MIPMQPATKNDARLDYACLSVVGEVVRVHTTDGCVVEGIFVSRDTQATGLRVVLSGARYAVSSVHTTADPAEILSTLRIDSEHVVMIEAIDSPMRLEAAAAGSVHVRRTDGPREMQRWSAIEDDDGAGLEDVSQAEQAWDTGKWDQFQANERLGVKSTYDEHHYTTKLDKTKFSKEQKAKADQLAKDITQGGAPVRGIQHAMERDEVDLSKHDEGELHTDVGRDKAKPISTGAAGAYVPPSRRSAHSAPPAEGPDSPGPQGAQTGSLRPTAVPFRPPGAVEEEAPQPPMPPQQQPPQQPPQHMTPEPVLEPVVLKPTPQPLRFPATDDYFNQFAHTLHEAMMMTGDEPGFSADWPGDDCYRGDTAAYQGAAQGMYPPQNAYMPQSAQQGMQGGAPQGGYRGQPQGNYGMEGGMSSGYQDGMMGQGSMGQGGYNQGGYSQGGYNQQQGGYNQGYNQGGQQGMHGQQGGYNQGYNGHGQGGGYGPSSGAQGGYNQAPQQPPQQPPQQQGGYNQGGYDQGYNQPRMGGNGGGQGGYNQGYNQGAPPPQSGGPQGGYNQQQNSYQQQQPPMPRGGSGMQNRGRGGYGQNYQSPAPAPQQGYPQGGGQGGQGGYGQQQGAYPGHQQSPPSNVPPPGPGQFMQQPEMPPQQAPPSGGMGRGRGGMGRGRGAGGPPREANNSPLPPQAGPRARGGRR